MEGQIQSQCFLDVLSVVVVSPHVDRNGKLKTTLKITLIPWDCFSHRYLGVKYAFNSNHYQQPCTLNEWMLNALSNQFLATKVILGLTSN